MASRGRLALAPRPHEYSGGDAADEEGRDQHQDLPAATECLLERARGNSLMYSSASNEKGKRGQEPAIANVTPPG